MAIKARPHVATWPAQLGLPVGEGAWFASSTTGRLCEGQRGLIYGASGAIGTAAVQLAKSRGAEVTAVVGTRHLNRARRLGRDRMINCEDEHLTILRSGLRRQGEDFLLRLAQASEPERAVPRD